MKKNLLALDLGKGSLGIAISRSGMFITPIENFRFHAMCFQEPLNRIKELLLIERVETFVLGLPLFPSGDPCEMTEIVYQDERYSTIEASNNLSKLGQNKKKQKKSIDRTASCVILERYLRSIGQIQDYFE